MAWMAVVSELKISYRIESISDIDTNPKSHPKKISYRIESIG